MESVSHSFFFFCRNNYVIDSGAIFSDDSCNIDVQNLTVSSLKNPLERYFPDFM